MRRVKEGTSAVWLQKVGGQIPWNCTYLRNVTDLLSDGKTPSKCVEAGLVIRLHLLFDEVRSVATALQVVEEVQKGLQEIEGE